MTIKSISIIEQPGQEPVSAFPLTWISYWDALTNTPALVTGVGVTGYVYEVSVAGATNIDDIATWNVGDYAIFNGAGHWTKLLGSAGAFVSSVAGQTGDVTSAQLLSAVGGDAVAADMLAASLSTTKIVTPSALAGASSELQLTESATIAWDMTLGVNAKVTLSASRQIGAPTNAKAGWTYILRIIQGGSGSYTISSWNACWDWGAAGAPTLSTAVGKYDVVSAYCISTSPLKFACAIIKGFG